MAVNVALPAEIQETILSHLLANATYTYYPNSSLGLWDPKKPHDETDSRMLISTSPTTPSFLLVSKFFITAASFYYALFKYGNVAFSNRKDLYRLCWDFVRKRYDQKWISIIRKITLILPDLPGFAPPRSEKGHPCLAIVPRKIFRAFHGLQCLSIDWRRHVPVKMRVRRDSFLLHLAHPNGRLISRRMLEQYPSSDSEPYDLCTEYMNSSNSIRDGELMLHQLLYASSSWEYDKTRFLGGCLETGRDTAKSRARRSGNGLVCDFEIRIKFRIEVGQYTEQGNRPDRPWPHASPKALE